MLYNIAYARGVLQAAQRVNDRRELSRGPGRAAARHGCEHKTCYMICGGVVATEARAQAPIASTAKAARSGRRAGLGAKFRPSSGMARSRFGPFSPVLDGRFIVHNTFILRNKKKGPCRVDRARCKVLFLFSVLVYRRQYPAVITSHVVISGLAQQEEALYHARLPLPLSRLRVLGPVIRAREFRQDDREIWQCTALFKFTRKALYRAVDGPSGRVQHLAPIGRH